MSTSTSKKYFHSGMQGAPILNGTAGSMIAVLDACLCNGFGNKLVDSLSVSSGIATMVISAGISFEQDAVVEVAGATPAQLNGLQRILSVGAGELTFAAPGVADAVAAGTITAKMAAAGWGKPFAGTNLAVFRSNDSAGTRMFLRVDDAGTMEARVTGYEVMTDASTGFGPFPSASQVSGGGYWPKANGANAAARPWTLVADSKSFAIHVHTATTNPGAAGSVWAFGDLEALKSGDVYACVLQCAESSVAASGAVVSSAVDYVSPAAGVAAFMPRSFTSVGSAIRGIHGAEAFITSAGVAGAVAGAMVPGYPNGPGNALLLTRKLIGESAVGVRGRMRGVQVPAHNCHASFSWGDKIDGPEGRRLLAVKCGAPAGTTSVGVLFFDITGPWGGE